MGIAADLHYSFPPPNLIQRLGQRIVSSRGGTWVMARTLPALDTAVGRLSGGRQSVTGIASALPVADLTTIGRTSGLRRTTHLICIPMRDTLALVGTNFGQPSTPDWVANLEANPQARLTFSGASVDAVARPATPAEFEEVMTTAAQIFIGYARYRRQITGRRVRIFVLEAA